MTMQEFLNKEIATWGQDYIFDLIDSGYTPVRVVSRERRFKWTWMKSEIPVLDGESLDTNLLTTGS